jgi:hypothetical protein
MPDIQDPRLHSLPVSNYSSAIARAVEWLGDRYLLAKPININASPGRQSSATEHRQPPQRLVSANASAAQAP